MNTILKCIIIVVCVLLYLPSVTAKRNLYIAGLYPNSGGWFLPLATVSAKLALIHINNRSDILEDYNLKIDWKDTSCDGEIALTSFIGYLNQTDRKYICVFGPGCSVSAVKVALITNNYGLPCISFSATSPSLSNADVYKLFARTVPPDTNVIPARVNFILKHGWKRVGIISQEEEIFTSAAYQLEIELNKHDIVVQRATFVTSAINDVFISQIENTFGIFAKENYRIIVTNMYQNAAISFFCRLKKYAENNELPYITWIFIGWYTNGWYNEVYKITNGTCNVQDIKDMSNGVIGFIPYPRMDDFLMVNDTTISGYTPKEIYDQYKNITINEMGNFQNLTDSNDPYAYDGIWAIALALNHTLQHGKNIEEQRYSKDSGTADYIYNQLIKEDFIGWTGHVTFTGNDRYETRVQVIEFVEGVLVYRGLYSNVSAGPNAQEDNFPFEYWNHNLASDGQVAFSSHPAIFPIVTVLALLSAIYITTLIVIILIATIKKLPPTVQSGPVMNIFILCGTYFLLFAAIRYSMTGSEAYLNLKEFGQEIYCYSSFWLLALALDITLGCIIIKASKYYLVWVENKFNTKIWYLIVIPIALVIFDTILTILAIHFSPYRLVQKSQESSDIQNPILLVETCTATSQPFYISYILIIYIPKLIIMLIGLFMAYHLRRVVNKAQKYSRIIVWAMYNSVLLSFLIFCLFIFIVNLDINAILSGLFAIIDALVIATIISAPVIYNTLRDPQGKKLLKFNNTMEFPENVEMLKDRIRALEKDLRQYTNKEESENFGIMKRLFTNPSATNSSDNRHSQKMSVSIL